ncbi:MAG TPA: hypothetical protein VI248_20300 [Kineosporiaceae bacterium]
MAQRAVVIASRAGLDARPAALLVLEAAGDGAGGAFVELAALLATDLDA